VAASKTAILFVSRKAALFLGHEPVSLSLSRIWKSSCLYKYSRILTFSDIFGAFARYGL
jgi:hypothetical protein